MTEPASAESAGRRGPIRLRWAVVPEGTPRRETAWRLLRELIGVPGILITNPCPRCGGPHGPVHVEGAPVSASVTYAAGFALAATAPEGAGRLGVDAEPERDRRRDAAGMRGLLGEGRTPSVRDWVRVEAALKADGRGVRVEPARVRIDDADATLEGDSDPPHWRGRIPGLADAVAGWDLVGPPGILVSAALARP